jgi:hypothetical protein
MKQLLIILSFLLLSSPLFGQSEETCYVAADSSKDFDRTLLSNISVSLISEFLKEVEPIPPAGISMNACVYQISAVKRKDTTFVTFTGKNLNSIGISKLSEPDGFQESLLKALYIALEDKRKLICDAYGEYIEKCGGVVKKIPAEKIETIREMKNKYDLFGKRIAVLDTRIERLNSGVVADNLILQKGTLFFHYLNNQWGWFMNSNGDKFEGKYFGEIVGLKPHGKGTTTYPNGFKSGDGKVELVGEWKEGEPWNITRYNKSGEITAKWVNGVMTDKESVVMQKSRQMTDDEPVVQKSEKDKTKGLFISVGSNGTFLSSPDGTNWTKRTTGIKNVYGTMNDLYGVTYGNGLFLAVGESKTLLTSDDGNSWTDRFPEIHQDKHCGKRKYDGTYHFFHVNYIDGLFRTYGGGTAFTSPDGTNWKLIRHSYECHPMNTYGKKGGASVYKNGLFVTVTSHGEIYTSTDEKNKRGYTQNSGTPNDLNDVTYGNGLFVVVGETGTLKQNILVTLFTSSLATILTSPDGKIWTKRNSVASDDLWAITYGNGLFVTVGNNGIIFTSPDGTNWTKRNSGTSDDLYDVTYIPMEESM